MYAYTCVHVALCIVYLRGPQLQLPSRPPAFTGPWPPARIARLTSWQTLNLGIEFTCGVWGDEVRRGEGANSPTDHRPTDQPTNQRPTQNSEIRVSESQITQCQMPADDGPNV